jgi:hypothetical protein
MIDLYHWSLTIPEREPARIIEAAQIQAGYSSKYFLRSEGDTSVTFWAPVTGTTTMGSSYPRSELRETHSNGEERSWLYSEARSNYLRAILEMKKVPSSGKVVIAQIHAEDAPNPLLKIQYRQVRGVGYVDLTLRRKPYDDKSPIVMTYKSMPLDTRFGYSVELSRYGKLNVNIAGLEYSNQIDSAWAKKRLYFKAGVYTLDNSGTTSEGGKAVFYKLNMGHLK